MKRGGRHGDRLTVEKLETRDVCLSQFDLNLLTKYAVTLEGPIHNLRTEKSIALLHEVKPEGARGIVCN
jgi:hypothetical protein